MRTCPTAWLLLGRGGWLAADLRGYGGVQGVEQALRGSRVRAGWSQFEVFLQRFLRSRRRNHGARLGVQSGHSDQRHPQLIVAFSESGVSFRRFAERVARLF